MLTRATVGAALAALALAAGCAKEAYKFQPPAMGDDAGPPRRVVPDGPPRDMAGGDRAGAGPAGDAARGGEAGATGAGVTVEIENLMPDMNGMSPVLRTREKFSLTVTVTVESFDPARADTLGMVTAQIISVATKKMVAAVPLNLTQSDTVPESMTTISRFIDSPIDLSKVESGDYEMQVVAMTMGGRDGKDLEAFRADAGPIIRIDQPRLAMNGKADYFRATAPVDVAVTDPVFGPVKSVVVTLGQTPIVLSAPGGIGNSHYTGTIEFKSASPPLKGTQIVTVRATNQNDTETVLTREFVADDEGPVIAIGKPAAGTIIGNVVEIVVAVSDPAGVVASSVVAVMSQGNAMFQIQLVPTGGGYTGLFDANKLPVNALFPSLSVRARDVLGNESTSAGHLLSLDNMPPIIEMDPRDIEQVRKTNAGWECSWPFDPVGPDAVDDGQRVAQLFDIRVQAEDFGNTTLSGNQGVDFIPVGGINPASVRLYILDDTSSPLILDAQPESRIDGLCDTVNPLIRPTTTPMSEKDALLIDLVALGAAGSADFMPGAPCGGGTAGEPPGPICETTVNSSKARWSQVRVPLPDGGATFNRVAHGDVATVWIGHTSRNEPSIWAVPPVVGDKLQCAGRQFDSLLAQTFKDGWACLAASAADKQGNYQVSHPIRICIDKDGVGKECPHRIVASVDTGTPITVTTCEPHNFKNGDEVVVTGVRWQTAANGRWKVQLIDARTFQLATSKGDAVGGSYTGLCPRAGEAEPLAGGRVVGVAEMPSCTGTQKLDPTTMKRAVDPMTMNPDIDSTAPCKPWATFDNTSNLVSPGRDPPDGGVRD